MAGQGFALTTKIDPEINEKLKIQLNDIQLKMIKIGGITNFISGFFVVWILYHNANTKLLFSWYATLIVINLLNIFYSYYFEYHKASLRNIKTWKTVYHLILALLCFAWSSMLFLFPMHNIHFQFFYAAFLLAVLVGFSIGTITDFVASIISISCLVIPTIIFKLLMMQQSIHTLGYDPDLTVGFIAIIIILSSFLLITCYVGYILIKRSLTLTLVNISLSKQLENSNKFLEQRVEERTQELRHQATHDSLTGLPNQTVLFRHLDTEIKLSKHKSHTFGVAFFSINQMELFIDAFGYKVWNNIIKEVSKRLYYQFEVKNPFPDTKYTLVITRRDEFAIIVTPLSSEKDINKVKVLHSVVSKPIVIEGSEIKLNASIGVSLYPDNGLDPRTLLMNADAAMLHGRREFAAGENVVFYKPMINANLRRKITLLNSLEAALEKHEFVLLYQPFVDLNTGRICGLEALTRWTHPTLGMITPDEFIPLIQITQGLYRFDRWVISTACNQVNSWNQSGFTNLKVAVNLSEIFLKQENIVEIINHILQETHFNPKNLEVELVETISFGETISENFHKLHELGIHFSIDDYGTGQADLGKIRAEQFSKIKIDKAFVKDMMDDERSKLIVLNAIALAKDMKMTILAEGVETEEQLNFLRENGCDMMQGYLFSKPVNAQIFTQMLIADKKLEFSDKLTSNNE